MEHISHTTTIILDALPHDIVPLFTASGECLWIADWNPEYIYPLSGDPQTGMIWKTVNNDQSEAIWVTVNYDTVQNAVTYLKFTPEQHVTRIDIQCDPANDSQTLAQITYTMTALSDNGHTDINKFTEAYYTQWIASWEIALNHYLKFGEALQHV